MKLVALIERESLVTGLRVEAAKRGGRITKMTDSILDCCFMIATTVTLMNQEKFALIALAAGGKAPHSPVQIQKLLFLLERKAGKIFDGPQFNFRPYAYGPFDKDVYLVLDRLSERGLVEISCLPLEKGRQYKLTAEGQIEGSKMLERLPSQYRKFVVTLSNFVRSLTFSQLVSAIYREYPEMKANSIFNG